MGKYDDSKKNFTEFAHFVAYSYNPSPGTKRRFDFFEEKVFKTPLPVNGKKRFKMLATDTRHHEGKVHEGPEDLNMLEKEGETPCRKSQRKVQREERRRHWLQQSPESENENQAR